MIFPNSCHAHCAGVEPVDCKETHMAFQVALSIASCKQLDKNNQLKVDQATITIGNAWIVQFLTAFFTLFFFGLIDFKHTPTSTKYWILDKLFGIPIFPHFIKKPLPAQKPLPQLPNINPYKSAPDVTCHKLFIFLRIFSSDFCAAFAFKVWWIYRLSISDSTFSLILKGFNIGQEIRFRSEIQKSRRRLNRAGSASMTRNALKRKGFINSKTLQWRQYRIIFN